MLVKVFEEQVKKHPHKIAIKSGQGFLTYLELNRFANRVARLIEKKLPGFGAGKEERIGLLFDHGLNMIAAILATLKAGGAYVPLSVDYPANRISYMLADSRAILLLTHSRHREMAAKLAGENSIDFIAIDKPRTPVPDEDRQREVKHAQLAYIMYTSGSTGKPKGVMQTHENVIYFIKNWMETFSVTDADRLTLYSSFCHDASLPDLFTGLHTGAVLYPYNMKNRQESIELSYFLMRERITIWHSVPSLFSYFANTLRGEEQFKDLRLIILGGEAVREHEVALFKKFFLYAALANLYGQTEATFVSAQLIGHEDNFERVTIRTPIRGARVFVIDDQGNPAEPLEPGEILVVCNHISPGYWQQEEATRAAFGEAEEFGKLYWTGDLGCLLPDGEIEFLGRKDFQVKIRGFRIELGEIESRLLEQENISEAVIVAREDESGDKYLCAYFVAASENTTPNHMELREYLAQTLPDYMIPTIFMQLERLPLTPNGKIDRKSLPDPVMQAQGAYIPPENAIEQKLAGLWAEVLGLEKKLIGANHNFFSLGGHSLKAVSLIAKIHQEFNVKLPLAVVFKTPTIRGISGSIRQAARNEFSAITPSEKRDYYALSSAQKRLYFLQQLAPDNTGYNMPFILPLGREIEKDRLEATLKQLISRHEGIRTSFIMIGEEPFQVIHDDVDFKIESGDNEGTGGLAPLSTGSFIRPFELSQAPLIRSGLIKMPDNNYTWLVDIHHIVSDGTSNMILAEDFMSLYRQEKLPPLSLQYKDFSLWQNHLFASGVIKHQQDYWLELYSGEIPRLNLSTDYQRPEVFTFAGDRYSFKLEREHSEALRRLARQHGATLYMNILAVLNVLFYKYTGQTDIIIGSGTAGRSHADLQRIIGMFVNILAMRNHPRGSISFESFLEETAANSIRALENQDVQFEELVEQLNLQRDLSRNPLFDISLVLQNFREIEETRYRDDHTRQPEGLPVTAEHQPQIKFKNPTSKFDMTFLISEAGDNIRITIEYYTAVFKRATIQRLASHFKNIIDTVNKNSSIILKDIAMISEQEKSQLLYEFNDTAAVDYPKNKSIQRLFREQVERTPDNTALAGSAQEKYKPHMTDMAYISYRELNKKAGQIACLLKEKGVEPGNIVAIKTGHSIEMIASILGILKAGAAYLPIDPEYPQERIDFILKDSTVGVLLTTAKPQVKVKAEVEENFRMLPQLPLQFINLETRLESVFEPSLSTLTSTLTCQVSPANLAYVIYTSGSAGKPKGVMVKHQALVNLCHWHNRHFSVTHKDRAGKYAGVAFDASVWEIFPYIICGASLYIIEDKIKLEVHAINQYFEKHHITISFLPTQVCEQFMAVDNSSLRILLTGGDKLHRFIKQNYCLVNNYGPTENTVVTTSCVVETHSPDIPIGKPIFNNFIYILNREGRLQPVGIPGELCIAGDSLALGYLNQPQLTAEKFDHDLWDFGDYQDYMAPFGQIKNAGGDFEVSTAERRQKIYRTGDLVKWQSDGNILFIGRLDQQVKIRGFRIESGEIENCLLQHPRVRQAVVMARQQPGKESNEKYLCAYIVPGRGQKPQPAEFRKYLAAQLPDYMIPAHFVLLEKIPLTAHGKVQRNALPEPALEKGEKYTAPGNIIEKRLALIWGEILCRNASHASPAHASPKDELIGINDNFFDLGGHSLKAAILAAKIHQTFQVKIPLKEIFSAPTIKDLAAAITRANKSRYIEIEKLKESDFYESSYHQKRLWVLHQLSPQSPAFHIPGSLVLDHDVNEQTIKKTVYEIVQRHESFRTGFKLLNDQPMQFIVSQIEPPLEIVDISAMKEEEKQQERNSIFKQIALTPFQLNQPPLFRSLLVKFAPRHYEFMFNMHHIISDGWSMEILKRDFSEIYQAHQRGEEVKLPPLSIQYKDFAAMHNKQINDPVFKTEARECWKKKLQGVLPVLKFHGSRHKNSDDKKGAGYHCVIAAQLKEKLEETASQNNTSLFMVMISVYILFLVRFSGQQDIACSFISAGREHVSLHNIIGFFVNSVIFKTRVDDGESFESFLRRVNNDILEIIEYQSYPLELLFEEMQMRYPDIPVSFNMINIQDATSSQELPLIQSPHGEKSQDVKFDLEPYITGYKNGIHIHWTYRKNLFTPKTIEYMASEYIKLLDYFASHLNSDYKTYRDSVIKPTFKKRG